VDGDIISTLDKEEGLLLRRLKAIRELKAAYGVRQEDSTEASAVRAPKSASREKVEIDGFGAYGRKVVAEAMRAMLTSGRLTKTSELVPAVEAMGITITGVNKVNALGALLARSVDITSHGKRGWEVVDREKALKIVAEYGHNESEAPNGNAAGASVESSTSGANTGWGTGPYQSRPLGAGESE
jgi:hypothetical protein